LAKNNTTIKTKQLHGGMMIATMLLKNTKKSLNRFKKSKDPNDHILLKKARAEARFITKSNKTRAWKVFTSSINHNMPPHLYGSKFGP